MANTGLSSDHLGMSLIPSLYDSPLSQPSIASNPALSEEYESYLCKGLPLVGSQDPTEHFCDQT